MEKQDVWIVLERWNLDMIDTDANVFSTEKQAKAYADAQAVTLNGMIEDSIIRHNQNGYYVCVEKEDNYNDEWWEARVVKRSINYKERSK